MDPSQDSNLDIGETVGPKKQYFRTLRHAVLALDPILTPRLFMSTREFLEAWDVRGKEREQFETMEEYWPYRMIDAGAEYDLLTIIFYLMRLNQFPNFTAIASLSCVGL